MMQAAGMPTLRTSRSVGQPILWWCPRQANLGQAPPQTSLPQRHVAPLLAQHAPRIALFHHLHHRRRGAPLRLTYQQMHMLGHATYPTTTKR